MGVCYGKFNGTKIVVCHKWRDYSPVYHKTYVLDLQTFLRDKFARWAGNGSYVVEDGKHFKDIVVEYIERCVTHKIPKKLSGS
jgi:hypothetical protein